MTQHHKERNDTDEGLRNERSKTDAQLEKSRVAIDVDADRVLELARSRAEGVLSAARERTDRELAAEGARSDVTQKISAERVDEDRAVAEERATADERLQDERQARRRALASLLDAEREITDERLVTERARADQVVATRDEFLAMISHDLRNLLSGMSMEGAVLARKASRQGDSGVEMLHGVERVQRFTSRMTRLVGDLIDVVSLEAGQLTINAEMLDVHRLLEEALEAFQPAFVTKGLTLTSQVSQNVEPATFDGERILQVLANLLGNALKFTAAGGHVAMAVAPCAAGLCFSVIDDGVGIPEAKLTDVFDRFRQATSDRRGLGLGLYIARCIVQAHGGEIWAERPAKGGTAIHFTIPTPIPR
ncbi:MAG: hypothetical protein JWN04_3652 [Myxococcaceae bacterium]|nr:hypothetical protein [Myxococcaceae bacterium]